MLQGRDARAATAGSAAAPDAAVLRADVPAPRARPSTAGRAARGTVPSLDELLTERRAAPALPSRGRAASPAGCAPRGVAARRRRSPGSRPNSRRGRRSLYRACWRLGAVAAPIHHQAGAADVDAHARRRRPDASSSTTLDDAARRARRSTELLARPASSSPSCCSPSGRAARRRACCTRSAASRTRPRMMAGVHGLGADDCVLMPAPLAHISRAAQRRARSPASCRSAPCSWRAGIPSSALDLIERERVTFMVGPPTFFVAAHGSARLHARAGRVAAARLERRRGRERRRSSRRRRERLGARGEAHLRVDRGADRRDEHAHGLADARARTTGAPSAQSSSASADGELLRPRPRAVRRLPRRRADTPTRSTPTAGSAPATSPRSTPTAGSTIVGRIKDVIIRGGENIATAEVEARARGAPRRPRRRSRSATPTTLMGERVVRVRRRRRRRSTSTRAARWFAERGVARFKTPERVVVVDDAPAARRPASPTGSATPYAVVPG